MLFKSTRGSTQKVTAAQAMIQGLAEDGGLYVPETFPKIDVFKDSDWTSLSYQELAYHVMAPFLEEWTTSELKESIRQAYGDKFRSPSIAPVEKVGNHHVLELFHGPTLAFKDMALSILPYLLKAAIEKEQGTKELVILTATSGDTGKAAMEGFADVPQTKIIVFYPKNGVSDVQEQQMLTQLGNNVFVVGVKGNFDEAQTKVKELFSNDALNHWLDTKDYQFSSANSINIGRLLPQVVYYFYAYAQLVKQGDLSYGEKMTVSVPTGNFGDILAGYYAKKMGLPIEHLICASNENDVLTRFFQTGTYDKNRSFHVTNSPSMDILVSSNLERLLYDMYDEDGEMIAQLMAELNQSGTYTISPRVKEKLSLFFGESTTEEESMMKIKAVYEQHHYVLDPHTAVAYDAADKYESSHGETSPILVLSTASPFKFGETVAEAIIGEKPQTMNEQLKKVCQYTEMDIPEPIQQAQNGTRRQEMIVEINEMEELVKGVLDD